MGKRTMIKMIQFMAFKRVFKRVLCSAVAGLSLCLQLGSYVCSGYIIKTPGCCQFFFWQLVLSSIQHPYLILEFTCVSRFTGIHIRARIVHEAIGFRGRNVRP